MAGWYDSNYKYRQAINVIDTAGASPQDVTVTIPPSWDLFWSTIQSTGYDIRVCLSDGVTLAVYDRAAGFSVTTKTLVIELDAINTGGTANEVVFLWLYFGYAAASDAITVFAPAAPVSGEICLEVPPADRRVLCGAQPPGATKPSTTLTKPSYSDEYVYWDVTDILLTRQSDTGGSLKYEGVWWCAAKVNQGGSDVAARHDNSKIRLLEHLGRIWVRTNFVTGTDANDYTMLIRPLTRIPPGSSNYRQLEYRALMMVRDVSEV